MVTKASKSKREMFMYDGNEIYELKDEYVSGSVKVTYKVGTKNTPLEVSEVGSRFVSVTFPDDMEMSTSFTVSYKTPDEVARRFDTDRLVALERRVLEQEMEIKELQDAMRNRISVKTFNAWLKSLEQKLGVEIISQTFQTPYPL